TTPGGRFGRKSRSACLTFGDPKGPVLACSYGHRKGPLRRAAGHARSDDPESARRAGPAARIRRRAAARADQRRSAEAERRHGVRLAAAPDATGLDSRRVGIVGEQSEGEVLLDHAQGPPAARSRSRKLGAYRRRYRPRVAACEPTVGHVLRVLLARLLGL